MDHELAILPVINKIDLVNRLGRTKLPDEMEHSLGVDADRGHQSCSAKTGDSAVDDRVGNAVIAARAGARRETPTAPLQAMVFDSALTTPFAAPSSYVRVMNGRRPHEATRFASCERGHDARGSRTGAEDGRKRDSGAITLSCRPGRLLDLQHQIARPGEHRRHGHRRPRRAGRVPLSGYQEPSRMVYLRPLSVRRPGLLENLRDALQQAVRSTTPASSSSRSRARRWDSAFRCGFLGLLHMEIVQQSDLEQESDIDLVQTAPNVTYEIVTKTGEDAGSPSIDHSGSTRRSGDIDEFRQPIVRVSCRACPPTTSEPIMKLCAGAPRRFCSGHRVPVADPGHAGRTTLRAGRSHLRPARQAEERYARLRHDGLRAPIGYEVRPNWCGSISSSTARKWTP